MKARRSKDHNSIPTDPEIKRRVDPMDDLHEEEPPQGFQLDANFQRIFIAMETNISRLIEMMAR